MPGSTLRNGAGGSEETIIKTLEIGNSGDAGGGGLMGNYAEYEEYKDSGVEWLPKMPKDWQIMSFSRVIDFLTDFEANGSFALMKDNVELDTDDNYAWYLRATDLENRRHGFVEGNRTCNKKTYDFLSKTKLYGGELLIAKRGEIGKVYVVPKLEIRTTLAPNLYLIRLNKNVLAVYLHYWFQSLFGRPQLELVNKSTTIGALYKDDVKACSILYPPLPEQQTIARFLDYKTAQIDALIAKKEALLARLAAKRTALISQAVTKGLDLTVPMKDSGVEWLGEIPAHWEVKRLKFISPEQSVGVVVNPSSYVDENGTIPFIYGANIREYSIDSNSARRITEESNSLLSKSRLRAGDLVVVRVGAPGVAAVVPQKLDGCNCASVMFVRQHENFASEWLCHAFNARVGRFQVEQVQYGAAQKQFNIEHAVDFVFPTPPLIEQFRLVAAISDLIFAQKQGILLS